MRADVGYLILLLISAALAMAFFAVRARAPRRERSFHYEFGETDDHLR